MGSGSSKESKAASRPDNARSVSGNTQNASAQAAIAQLSPQERQFAQRVTRGSRPDIPILGLIRGADNAQPSPDRPRETRPERELRKAEKEKQLRLKERERSMREEHVDGGYLVTLGVYTGPEDYSKPVVRQLQIERRLAPFWKGLNDHSSSWTEAQLVAAARGLPIPEPDEIPPPMSRTGSQASSIPRSSDVNMNSLTVPIGSRSQSHDSGSSANISPSRPIFSSSGPASPSSPPSSTAQLFRGRAKTLASLATGSKNPSPDLTPQEIKLPKDPNVNGQPMEAYLYKDASECPICFMYYPPYLNKTRCCDQAICSECFVQIKRPDPHPPEHEQPNEQRPPEEEAEQLVSEVASCPFCVTPEFGITYDPPPFRRGLAYSKQSNRNPLLSSTSAMSSSSSINTNGRRRTMSISATSPQVITTDRVRPDWAKKLADARAHVLRRSAAATALHNAAYVLGSQGDSQLRGLAGFRRRTSLFDTARMGASGNGQGAAGLVLRASQREGEDGSNDMYPARGSSRRTQVQDLEDLMMMEAIRLSIAAEEERKKKEDKEAKKDAKKKAKEEKKEAKQAEKLAKKGGASSGLVYSAGPNDSSSTWESNDAARSNSNLLVGTMSEEHLQGKGKAPAQDFAGFNPLFEPTSTLNTEMAEPKNHSVANETTGLASSPTEDAQRHLEESRANLQPATAIAVPEPTRLSPHSRQMSDTPSVASSMNDSSPGSAYVDFDESSAAISGLDNQDAAVVAQTDTPSAGTPSLEPMVNFQSLAAMIGSEEDNPRSEAEATETAQLTSRVDDYFNGSNTPSSPQLELMHGVERTRSRGDSGESNSSAPPVYDGEGDQITPAPVAIVHHDVDSKEIGGVNLLEHVGVHHQATQ